MKTIYQTSLFQLNIIEPNFPLCGCSQGGILVDENNVQLDSVIFTSVSHFYDPITCQFLPQKDGEIHYPNYKIFLTDDKRSYKELLYEPKK